MDRARNRWLPLLRALSLLALASVWAIACGGPQEQGASGSVCFRSDDCKDGLACVPTAAGSSRSVCSADLSVIVAMVDGAPPDSATPLPDASAAGALASDGRGGNTAVAGGGGKAAGGGGGKAATGGTAGAAGKSSGGATAGGGAAAGGSGAAGSATAGSATAGSATGGGSGGSEPMDAGDG